MKKLYSSALFFFVLGSVLIQGSISGNQIFEQGLPRVGQLYVPGEFLVKFKPNVSEQTINTLNSSNSVSTIYTSPYTGLSRMKIPSDETVANIVEIYQANDNVEYAEAKLLSPGRIGDVRGAEVGRGLGGGDRLAVYRLL